MDKFWMVWCENGSAPTFQHPSLQSAKDEAQRLAVANHARKFIVLESQEFCYINNPVVWDKTRDEVPF